MADSEPLRIQIAPGLFTENTERRSSGRWKDGDKVRFHKGLPRKLGGWQGQALTGGPIKGKVRRVHEWQSIDRQNWIAIGTSSKLYLLNQSTLYDITPQRRQITRTNPFTTTNTSPIVRVDDVGHDAIAGDYVRFADATAVGGLTLNGEYQVVSVLGVDAYTVNAGAPASSGATGGGNVTIQYDINNGGEDTGFYYGWGTCTWGLSTWGTPRGVCTTMKRNLRIWSLDNWGEDLIASPSENSVYWWDRTLGPTTRASLIVEAPFTNQRVLVSAADRQLICLGAHDGSAPDPMRIRVSDRGNFNNFGPATAQNRVYTKRIDTGSKIITGFLTRRNVIIFTDKSVHLMQPVDGTLVYSVTQIAEKNSIMGPNAGISIDGVVYLMGPKKFFYYDGVYQELECDVWTKVFENFNYAQADKVYCWFNSTFGEIWWHYPSALASECDRYVIYHIDAETWTYGSMDRTAGNDRGAVDRLPYAISSTGTFYLHESGVDDNGVPMVCFLESYDAMIGEGQSSMHMKRIIPDFKAFAGALNVFLKTKKYPEDPAYVTKGPYAFTPARLVRGSRARGKQVAIRYESSSLGDNWVVGDFTYEAQPDNQRGSA